MVAYRFYYLNKNSFGGSMTSFNSYYRDKPYLNDNSIKLLKKAHERLKEAWIENQDYREIIKKFDKENTLFYLDPPYYETNNSSYKFGQNINFEELANILSNIKGKFILSINGHNYIKELFKNFNIQNIEVQYNISKEGSGRKKFEELIITNYSIQDKMNSVS
jgi:DNA adenine methylase